MNEILSLRIKDIILKMGKGLIHVVGKGNKLRTTTLLDDLVDCLSSYINEFYGQSPMSEALLFYSRIYNICAQLTQEAITKRLKKDAAKTYEKCSDMSGNFHAHVFRHT